MENENGIVYNEDLFHWLVNVLKKYGEGDAIEIITLIFMNARNKDWNKNQVYKRLERYEIDNPKLIEELYSRFDELVRESYSL